MAADALLGRRLDGYTLEARIGTGATGHVYRASHPEQPGPVAVKVLNEGVGRIRSLRRRFQREARALGALEHPHVVKTFGFGVVDEDIVYIAMELLEGCTLEDTLQERALAPEEALTLMDPVLSGVACAHEQQIVHRDLKPANVFLDERGEGPPHVTLLDFGLAKFLEVDAMSGEGALTRKGRVVGTPAYMAPEQITGVSLDVRADVYALGVLFFELLADRRPFDYARRSELLRAHLFEPVPALAEVRPGLEVHPAVEALLRRALAKDPDDRFPDAGAMREALLALPDDAVSLRPSQEGHEVPRSRTGTSSVVISAEERAELSDESGPWAPLPTESGEANAPTADSPAETAAVPPQDDRSAWLTGALWALGLAGLGALVAVAVYATTL